VTTAHQPEGPEDVIGVWTLVGMERIDAETGALDATAFSAQPKGMLIYTPGGHMSAYTEHGSGRPALKPDHLTAPDADKARAIETVISYCGRYRVENGAVIHIVDLAWDAGYIGQEHVRHATLEGDRLTLYRAPADGHPGWNIHWQRAE